MVLSVSIWEAKSTFSYVSSPMSLPKCFRQPNPYAMMPDTATFRLCEPRAAPALPANVRVLLGVAQDRAAGSSRQMRAGPAAGGAAQCENSFDSARWERRNRCQPWETLKNLAAFGQRLSISLGRARKSHAPVYFRHRFKQSCTGGIASGPPKPCPAPFIGTKVTSTPAFFSAA